MKYLSSVRKICEICGAEYEDYSRGHTKVACSNKCRNIRNYQNPEKDFDRKFYLRIQNFKRNEGIEYDERTIERIKADVKTGKCMICGRQRRDGENDFHIDHDHKTGKYRGVLCLRCNTSLSIADESQTLLTSWFVYLMKNNPRCVHWDKVLPYCIPIVNTNENKYGAK